MLNAKSETHYRFRYVLDETSFYESQWANMIIQDAMGPLHPGASFTLHGGLSISSDNRSILISVLAKGPNIPKTAGGNSLTWEVTAALQDNSGTIISEKPVGKKYWAYFTNPGSIVIGEAVFSLPEPVPQNDMSLFLEGTYEITYGPHDLPNRPRVVPIFGSFARIRRKFLIRVEHEE